MTKRKDFAAFRVQGLIFSIFFHTHLQDYDARLSSVPTQYQSVPSVCNIWPPHAVRFVTRMQKHAHQLKGDVMSDAVCTAAGDAPENEGDGIFAGLAALPPGTIVTLGGLAKLLGKCEASIIDAVERDELPRPVRIM